MAAGAAWPRIVSTSTTQTLANKTLTNPKIVTTGAICDGGGDEYVKFVEGSAPVTYVQIASGNTGVAPKVQGAGETNTDLHLLGSGTGNVKISDGTAPTKLAVFELNGATAGKTTTFAISQTDDRTITFPDATDTLMGKATTDTMTNKTLTAPVMTSPDITFGVSAHSYENGHADWTLSAAEMKSLILTTSAADQAVIAYATPTSGKIYAVYNATGQNLTIKATGQTGVTIANTKTALVRGNGTDFVRVTADA